MSDVTPRRPFVLLTAVAVAVSTLAPPAVLANPHPVLIPQVAQDFTQLAWFDANPTLSPPQRFKRFVNHPKFNQFDRLQYGQGYQLYCKNPAGVTLTLKEKSGTGKTGTVLIC